MKSEACDIILGTLDSEHTQLKLLPDERHLGGNGEAERKIFNDLFQRILGAQSKFAAENPDGKLGRGQHRNRIGPGTVTEVEVLPGIPESYCKGFFALPPGTKFIALSRFSDGMGITKPFIQPDVTGYAIKILGVDLSKPIDANFKIPTWDLTFTKSKSGFGENPENFVRFVELQTILGDKKASLVKKVWGVGKWIVTQPRAAYRIATSVFRPYGSVLLQKYGSGHPYAIDDKTPMVLSVAIESPTKSAQTDAVDPASIQREVGGLKNFPKALRKALRDSDSAGTDLTHWLSQGDVHFVLCGHLLPQNATPSQRTNKVENGLEPWTTPGVPLLRITLLKQSPDEKISALTELLGWNPRNTLYGHRAVGSTGRGRVYAYAASQFGRWLDAAKGQGISPLDFFDGKGFQPAYREIVDAYHRLKGQTASQGNQERYQKSSGSVAFNFSR